MRGVLVRLPVVVISIVALAWIGVLARDQHLGEAASDRILGNPDLSQVEFDREQRRLEHAELLNPDSTWEFNRGVAWLGREPRRAATVLEALVRSEPENVRAWRVLRLANQIVARRESGRAEAEIRRLDPIGAQ